VRIVFDNFLRIYKAKEDTLDEFRDRLTFKNPDRGRAEARIKRGQYVDVIPPKWIRCFDEFDDHLAIPVGVGLDFIKEVGWEFKELVQIQDIRSDGHDIAFKVPEKGRFKGYDPHQDKIIATGISNYNAVISSPTGSGKTIGAFGIIERIQSSTIILVDRTDLLEQWVEDLEDFCDGGFSIGILGGGTKRLGDVTVATVQTLRKMPLSTQEELKKEFGVVIVDEVHKAAAPIFVDGSTVFASRYKLGLSATPYRKDRKDFVFKSYIGNVELEITDKVMLSLR
jgi:superfamily II DNA or RNA helicase